METTLTDKLAKASLQYGEHTIIRSGIIGIPFVGGSLDFLLSARGQNYTIKRINTFISELWNWLCINIEHAGVNSSCIPQVTNTGTLTLLISFNLDHVL